jgi:hypothetical protein
MRRWKQRQASHGLARLVNRFRRDQGLKKKTRFRADCCGFKSGLWHEVSGPAVEQRAAVERKEGVMSL